MGGDSRAQHVTMTTRALHVSENVKKRYIAPLKSEHCLKSHWIGAETVIIFIFDFKKKDQALGGGGVDDWQPNVNKRPRAKPAV